MIRGLLVVFDFMSCKSEHGDTIVWTYQSFREPSTFLSESEGCFIYLVEFIKYFNVSSHCPRRYI